MVYHNLKLTRPLVFFDLETTGTNIIRDRIVEISILKIFPDQEQEPIEKTRRINPGMHIPEQSSAVHGIYDEDVKDCPRFHQIARSLHEFLEECDIAGFNSNKFDVPLLIEEFARAGINFGVHGHRFIDVQNIFHKKEPRTLSAAYRFYCNADLEDAHSANADTRATFEVLKQQLEKYDDLENDIDYLSEFSRMGNGLDLASRIVRNEKDEPVFNFGKHKGKRVEDVFRQDPSFLSWVMQGEFPKNTKDVLQQLYFQYKNRK
ncbi:MAG: 3'-5' exonuclease [Muribaculaceae bacterium]|nr:3'-5' exonuclease [Muribaculaceae bacterium]